MNEYYYEKKVPYEYKDCLKFLLIFGVVINLPVILYNFDNIAYYFYTLIK